jgi:hypothetical protein
MKNTSSQPIPRLCALAALAIAICAFSVASEGQGITGAANGEPVIATGATTATSDASYIDAYVYTLGSTSDMCTRIEKAWASLTNSNPSSVIDARAFTGAQTCLVSPFPTFASTPLPRYGVLLLGNAQIETSVVWNIPARVRVQGLGSQGGEGTATGTENTLIYANTSSFPGSSPVVQLGNPDSLAAKAYQSQIANLTIDCMGVSNCVGLLNDSAEEASYAENIIVFNAPAIGVHITSTSNVVPGGAGNSGPYRNISIQYSTCNCTTAIGLQVDGQNQGMVIRGFDNFTVSGLLSSGSGISEPGVLIYGAPTEFTNSHVEYFGPGIQIGDPTSPSPYPTANVQVQNVNIADNQGSWDILIDSTTTYPVGDVLLVGVNSSTSNNQILDDSVTGNKITGSNLGYYLLGDANTTTPANTAVISTSPTVSSGSKLQWVDPGNLDIIGSLSKGSGTFKIDDPLDPPNKYLKHSFVESPDMMNVYNGNVTTDKRGLAVITLPKYFQALNKDFRYQLTAMGTFAQATVAKEIHNNEFTIRTSKPGVKVSWQVTGIRHDAFAEKNPVQVEEEKSPRDRGHYLHPEAANAAQPESPQE